MLLPLSIAGLPTFSAWVCVGPPLFASAPRFGLMGVLSVPTRSLLTRFMKAAPVKLPIKLLPALLNVPSKSGFNGAVFPAMIELPRLAVAVLKMPPPWLVALLRVRVLLLRSRVPPFLIAPKLVALLPENVLLVMVAAPPLKIAPPFCPA